MTTYVCIYCQENLPSFSEILTHVIESHSEQILKFSQKDGANIKVKNFKIIPEICRQQGRSITVNKTRETIHISRCNTVAKDSPCGKVSKPTDNDSRCNTVAKDSPCDKVSKPTDNDSRCNTVAKDSPCDKVSKPTDNDSRCNTVAKDSSCDKVSKPTDNDSRCNTVAKDSPCDKVSKPTDNDSRCNTVAKDSPCDKVSKPTDNDSFDDFEVDKSEDLSLLVDDKDEEYTEIVSLIPTVIDDLQQAGKLTEYISFHKLVSDGKFPLDNLAFLLFLDVV